MNELESLKPAVQRQVDELNKGHFQSDAQEIISYSTTPAKKQIFPSSRIEQVTKVFPECDTEVTA